MKRKITIVAATVLLSIGIATPALAGTNVNVGGGTWNYGTAFQPPWFKNVWSHYVHPSKYHSATAIGGPNNVKKFAVATRWANADTQCGAGEHAAEYWSTY